ncbi:lipopolysaccharide biosynthesis protein [Photobacterium sp.]|uniref:lipopolysaccharide biosynthesis protein n=1 Tax=Photobacterium sp. TaxID=660 RepID=UPI00299D198A|nr:lipopolysaccharide biosynthesis protein [Photobacterium sp.]MDX1301626.1 lipopolysaccharide biosynthesis protein [Photobacterium sp.]
MTDKSHSSHVLDGAVITTAAAIIQGLGQILVLAVLARYITQTEFGLVTLTMVVIGLGRQFAEALIRPVIVQKESLSTRDIGTASLLSWVFGAAALFSMWLLAPAIGRWFSEPDIEPIITALSCVFLLQAPSLVAEGLLHRELKFTVLAFSEVLSFVFGYTLVGVTLALAGVGVWALVWACIAQVGLKSVILIWKKLDSLHVAFDRGSFRHILWMAGGFSSGKLLGYAATQVDYLVVAGAMNSTAVGIYGRAYQLVTMPVMLFGQVLERVMFPVYSRLQSDPQRATEHYGHAIALSAIMMAPTSVLFVVLAPEIVRLILGPDWSETVLPLQILASTLLFRMGYKLNDSLTKAFGLVYQRAWRLAVYTGAVVICTSFGVQWGLPGVAVGVSLAIFLNFILMAQLSLGRLKISWSWFALKHARGTIYALCLLPLAQATAMTMRHHDVGYMGIIFGVLGIIFLSISIVAMISPDLIVGPDVRWLARLVGCRLKPKSDASILPGSRNSIIVEFCGLTPEEKTILPEIVINLLKKQGIPATDMMQHLARRNSGIGHRIRCLRLALKALKRAPRETLYQTLIMIGSENEAQKKGLASTVYWLALGELVSKAQTTPGVHLLIDGPMQQLSVESGDYDNNAFSPPQNPLVDSLRPDLFLDLRDHQPVSFDRLFSRIQNEKGAGTLVVDFTERQSDIKSRAHDVAEYLVSNWKGRVPEALVPDENGSVENSL